MARTPFKPVYDDAAEDWERTYAMWCHLAPLIAGVGVVASDGIAFFVPGLVAAILWLIKRHESPLIDDHGQEAVNFQISLAILYIAVIVVTVVTLGLAWYIAVSLWYILALVGMIQGVIAAKDGRYFRYPACMRLLACTQTADEN